MYNKALTIFNNNIEEIVLNLKDSCLEKVLYYRDEGNVSRPLTFMKHKQSDVIKICHIFR